jgi:nucleotide-binding universal stress UspA family protein
MDPRIVVPLDGSPFSAQVIPCAAALGRALQCPLELVTVHSSGDEGEGAQLHADGWLERIASELRPELTHGIGTAVLDDQSHPADYPPPATRTTAHILARHAEQVGATALALATHGRSGLRRAWHGSVAESLVRVAPCPVLLVRPRDQAFTAADRIARGFRHVLVPHDGSETSDHALPRALRVAQGSGARISLLRVVSPLAFEAGARRTDPPPPEGRAAAAAELDRIAASVRDAGVAVAADVVVAGAPAAAIMAHASSIGADLIAMGTGAPGKIRRLLLGSVADQVVRESEIPVLLCRGDP